MPRLGISLVIALVLQLGCGLATPGSFARAQEAAGEVVHDRGIAYGNVDGQELLVDVYQPSSSERLRPAVILLPGWEAGRASMIEPATALAQAGYVAIAVDYRLHWPEHIDDAQLAVRWIRANAERYGIDPQQICSYGQSTGGQLAAMLGVRDTRDDTDPELADYSSRVACVVTLAGEHDMTIPYTEDFWNTWLVEQLGGTLEDSPEAYKDVSPVAFVDEQSAPFLVIHGGQDTVVPMEHSRRLVAALEDASVEVIYADLVDEDHETVQGWNVSGPFALAFLDRHLE